MMTDQQRKLVFFLPNTFTALNIACGFASILLSQNGNFYQAAVVLILGAIFDSVDGRVARLTGTQSHFGEQFDSMSDLVTFGMAPAILFYLRFLDGYGRIGMVASFLFLLCGALRLARFNANIDKVSSDYFQGLPIPSAAMSLVGYVLLSTQFSFLVEVKFLSIIFVILHAILMITSLPFPSFKNSPWIKKHKKMSLLFIVLVFLSLGLAEEFMVSFWLTLYVFGSLIYFIVKRKNFENIFNFSNENEKHE